MEPTASHRNDITPGLVLVADDDPALLVMARSALEQDGHIVAVATDGREACRLFADRVPDLIVLDIAMPVLNGYDTCATLRRGAEGARTPILMLTGSDDPQAVARSYDVGATDFQTKPLNWRVFRERIRYMLKAKRDADDLTQLAHYDSLTGLPNRATFRDTLTRGVRAAEARTRLLAVFFLDLDGFKEINDTYGHGFGDQVLKLAANRLTHDLREGDAVDLRGTAGTLTAGRFGGDEFTVCASNIPNVEAATVIADRIRQCFASPFRVDGSDVFVTASTGVSVYPHDGTDADTLLKHADAAMYDAKAGGRNHHASYRPVLSAKASERLTLTGELRRAIDREEFVVHYQPKVEIQTGRVVGAEALIRWNHPARGLLVPGEFIEFAEECGLGPQIGDWVLQTTLADCQRQRDDGGVVVPIALNVSDSQFRSNGFLDHVMETLATYGLDARCLELEITESVVIHNPRMARERLAACDTLGIKTSIDDFGTGQSALSSLRGLPAHGLKIDSSFIRDLDAGESGFAIAASIVDIGHHLRMTVIAEGVETHEQLSLLASMGCDQAQGFLFSRGLPAVEYHQFLAGHMGQTPLTAHASR